MDSFPFPPDYEYIYNSTGVFYANGTLCGIKQTFINPTWLFPEQILGIVLFGFMVFMAIMIIGSSRP